MHNYRFDYAPEGGNAQRVSFAKVGFSREAQRTRSSSSSAGSEEPPAAAARGEAAALDSSLHVHHDPHVSSDGEEDLDCLHLPSDKEEADWLCVDFARARRELRRVVEGGGRDGVASSRHQRNDAKRIWSLIEEREGGGGGGGGVHQPSSSEAGDGKSKKPPSATRGVGFTVRPRSAAGGSSSSSSSKKERGGGSSK